MFSFLSRNKNAPHHVADPPASITTNTSTSEANDALQANPSSLAISINNQEITNIKSVESDETRKISNNVNNSDTFNSPKRSHSAELHSQLDEIRKNLYESIIHKRTDIVVSLINEWFKGI
jgi:hypothetical protein